MVWIVARASRVKGPGGSDIGIADFPNFDRHLRSLNRVISQPRIWNAFTKWSGLSKSQAQMSVSYGSAPAIDFLPMSSTDYGGFEEAFPHRIWLRIDKVREYENRLQPASGRFLHMLILHEMVHWGRHLFHLPDSAHGGYVDNGDNFENEAYDNPYNP